MDVTNTTKGDRILPDGTLIPAGATVKGVDLAPHKSHPVVKAWLDEGELVTGKAPKEDDEDEDIPAASRVVDPPKPVARKASDPLPAKKAATARNAKKNEKTAPVDPNAPQLEVAPLPGEAPAGTGAADAGSLAAIEAKHAGGGSYAVTVDGKDVLTRMSKAEADAFNASSPVEKAKLIEGKRS